MGSSYVAFWLMQGGIPVVQYTCLSDAIADAKRMGVRSVDHYYIKEIYEDTKFKMEWFFDLDGNRYETAYDAVNKAMMEETV